MSWVEVWDRTAAAVMAVLIEKMPIDEAAKAAHDAADALLAEANRRDAERRRAEERRAAEFERAWEALYDQFADEWSAPNARARAMDNVRRIFNEQGGDADATIAAVLDMARTKGVLA